MSPEAEFTSWVIDSDQSLPLLNSEGLVFWHAQTYHFALLWNPISFAHLIRAMQAVSTYSIEGIEVDMGYDA